MSNLPIGPRRDAVDKIERDIEITRGVMDLALEGRDWAGAATERLWLIYLYEEEQRLLTCPLHEIQGAVEWFQERDRQRRRDLERADGS